MRQWKRVESQETNGGEDVTDKGEMRRRGRRSPDGGKTKMIQYVIITLLGGVSGAGEGAIGEMGQKVSSIKVKVEIKQTATPLSKKL